ncbi:MULTISPECIES: hypothetical protein [unclassified Streptomyces]|uniref:hypothetical protein n=1 Tax=unclassified Streptomyces TaxID=2593676 RepID=UPI00381553E4
MQEREQDRGVAQRRSPVRHGTALPGPEAAAGLAARLPGGLSPAAVTQLQRSVGNTAVAQVLKGQEREHGARDGHDEASRETPPQRRTTTPAVLGTPGRLPVQPTRRDRSTPVGGAGLSDAHTHDDAAARQSAQEVGAQGDARRVLSGDVPVAAAGQPAVTRAATSATSVVQRRKPSADAPREHFAAKAQDHPEWPVFQKLMAAGGFPPDVVGSAWQLLLGGVAEQERLNVEASDASLDPADRRARRASNTWYRELVNLMGDHLRITTPTMALWSGGFDVSVYAQSKGHTPLEFTRLGKVVDQLELHADWKLQAPLWNVLSRAFVERATGPVHVFLRAYNPDSVLIAQEIPQLRVIQRINPAVTVMWHPLYTSPDGAIKEISDDFRLTDDAAYSSRDKCVAVMHQYLLRFHDASNSKASMAYREMGELLAQNGTP